MGWIGPEKVSGNQTKILVLYYLDCEELLVKIPIIKEHRLFYQSQYCKDYGNQGSDNQGIAVCSLLILELYFFF